MLKTVVIVLGVLIIIAFAVMVGTIINRLNGMVADDAVSLPAAGQSTDSLSFGNIRVAIPAGYRVAGAEAAGRRLVVRLEPGSDGSGEARILVFDLATGVRLGSFTFEPERLSPRP